MHRAVISVGLPIHVGDQKSAENPNAEIDLESELSADCHNKHKKSFSDKNCHLPINVPFGESTVQKTKQIQERTIVVAVLVEEHECRQANGECDAVESKEEV